jgi:hypothetical protein
MNERAQTWSTWHEMASVVVAPQHLTPLFVSNFGILSATRQSPA